MSIPKVFLDGREKDPPVRRGRRVQVIEVPDTVDNPLEVQFILG